MNVLTNVYLKRTFTSIMSAPRKSIDTLLAIGVPKARIARRVGITRQDLYAYLDPQSYRDRRLADETLGKIAAFEGRSLKSVRSEYEAKAAA